MSGPAAQAARVVWRIDAKGRITIHPIVGAGSNLISAMAIRDEIWATFFGQNESINYLTPEGGLQAITSATGPFPPDRWRSGFRNL